MSVEFHAENLGLLKEALKKLGWSYVASESEVTVIVDYYSSFRLDLKAGTAVLEERFQGKLNELKRAYSSAAIDRVARLNQWTRKGANNGLLVKF